MKEGGGGMLVSDKKGMVDDERLRSLFYAEHAETVEEILSSLEYWFLAHWRIGKLSIIVDD